MTELLSGFWWGKPQPPAILVYLFQMKMELLKQLKSATLFCFTSKIQVITLLKFVFHSD